MRRGLRSSPNTFQKDRCFLWLGINQNTCIHHSEPVEWPSLQRNRLYIFLWHVHFNAWKASDTDLKSAALHLSHLLWDYLLKNGLELYGRVNEMWLRPRKGQKFSLLEKINLCCRISLKFYCRDFWSYLYSAVASGSLLSMSTYFVIEREKSHM